MKIYNTQNNQNNQFYFPLPDDIILHIFTFVNNRDKNKLTILNHFYSKNYHVYLNINQIIYISCNRFNMKIIEHYFHIKKAQLLIFENIINMNKIEIFNILPIDNLYSNTYETIIIKSCVNNYYKYIKKIYNYIQDINFDIVYVKNAFSNKFYDMFKLLYTLPIIYSKGLYSIFIEACGLGIIDIVTMMLDNPNMNPSFDGSALCEAIGQKQYKIVELLIANERVNQNMFNCCAFRRAVKNNNLEMIKILFTDDRININNLNISNIHDIMDNPEISKFILASNRINYNFINICIYSYLIKHDINMVKLFIQHPRFNKNTLFPNYEYNHILLNNFTNLNDIEILDILIDNTSREFIHSYLNNYYVRYLKNINSNSSYYNYYLDAFKIIINLIVNKINDKDYVLTCILDILNSNTLILESVYNDINNYIPFFDYIYNLEYYGLCRLYLQFSDNNIHNIIHNFNKGKYSKITKLLINYY